MSNQDKEKPSIPKKEIVNLPEISINFQTEILGKNFTYNNNATDFMGSRSLINAFDLIHSPWAIKNIKGSEKSSEKAISGNHLQTCAFSSDFSFVNIEWFSEADWALQIGQKPNGWRKFPQTEMRKIDNPQNNIREILKSGYPLFSQLSSTRNIITVETGAGVVAIERNPLDSSTPDQQYFNMTFITNQEGEPIIPKQRILSITNTGYKILKENETDTIGDPTRNLTNPKIDKNHGFTGSDEQVIVSKNGDKLWDHSKLINNQDFQTALSTAFVELKKGNKIIILKKHLNETQWPVLMAQMLTQMLLREDKSLISWSTQFKAFSKNTRNFHELGKSVFDFDLSFATQKDLDELGVDDNRLVIDFNLNNIV